MEKIIYTDCDGVLLDWEPAFCEWMENRGYTVNPEYATHYKMSLRFSGNPDKPYNKDSVRQFNESAAIGFLPPLRDAVEYVQKIVDLGYKFTLVTSQTLDKHAQALRIQNLKRVFGSEAFKDFIILDTGADKDEALINIRFTNRDAFGSYWIEDKPENAMVGAELGFKSILVEHGHNADFVSDDLVKAKNWEEIYGIVKNQ